MGGPFSHELRVRFAECDPQGVVFNAHFLAYFDISITELWRAAFGSYQTMLDRGVDVVVAEARLSFARSARFDDVLRLDVAVTKLGNTSIRTRHTVWREGEELVQGEMCHVLVELPDLRKKQLPDWTREGLAPWVSPRAERPRCSPRTKRPGCVSRAARSAGILRAAAGGWLRHWSGWWACSPALSPGVAADANVIVPSPACSQGARELPALRPIAATGSETTCQRTTFRCQ